MRSANIKKYFCVLVVLLFVIPSVTALNVGNGVNNQKDNIKTPQETVIDEQSEDNIIKRLFGGSQISIEVRNILNTYSLDELDESTINFLIDFNERMVERNTLWFRENPQMPYEPLDITGKIATIDPKTGEMANIFPHTDMQPLQLVLCDPNNYQPNSLLSGSPNSIYTAVPEVENSNTKSSSTRGSRAPAEADVELVMLEWDYVQEGWAVQNEIEQVGDPPEPLPGDQYSYGAFQVGKKTTFTATVRNNNPGSGSVNVWVNFSIIERYTGIPMDKMPTSFQKTVGSSPITVNYEFTPQFAGVTFIQCAVNYINDPNNSNNYFGLYGIPVFIWSADLETSGTNFGWQQLANGNPKTYTKGDWTGDIEIPSEESWHTTANPANNNNNLYPSHSSPTAWFHGEDVGTIADDTYHDQFNRNIGDHGRNHSYLQTPFINMGDILDGPETVAGLTQANTYIPDFNVMFSCLITGEYEEEQETSGAPIWAQTDWADVFEHNDDNQNHWWREYLWEISVRGDWSTLSSILTTPQTTPHWNPNGHIITDGTNYYFAMGYPIRTFISDGSGGVDLRNGQARNWTTPGVRFRVDFTGDGEDDQNQETGCYYDDFVTWGIQEYTPANRVGFTEVTYPKTSGVSILYKDSTASFTTKVTNYGQSASPKVKVTIKDMDGNTVFGPTEKSAGNLAEDQESSAISWSWSPEEEGEYILIAICDNSPNYDSDWTPADNYQEFYLHVRSPENEEVDILVVDDDNSGGQGGSWLIGIEDRMLTALDDNEIKYRVYTVEYNETGPTADVMDDYECVIWQTGADNEFGVHGRRYNYNKNNPAWDICLKSGEDEDIDQLTQFLTSKGKKLWLISPGLLYDQYGTSDSTVSTAPGDFAYQYLRIDRGQTNVTEYNDDGDITVRGTPNPLEGVVDSIMDDVEYETYDTEAPFGFGDVGGWVAKDTSDQDTNALFYQDDTHFKHNALQYKTADRMTAYFIFNFFLIEDEVDRQDCVYRILTGFGMTGGVTVHPQAGEKTTKIVSPGEEARYRLKVTNTGKKQDTMTLSVSVNYPKDYPSGYTWRTNWEGKDVKKVGNDYEIDLNGLASKNDIYLKVTAPVVDDFSDYPKAGTTLDFIIKAISDNTKIENSTKVKAKLGAVGNITMTCDIPSATIDVEKTAEFLLKILNKTNGDENVEVTLSFSGAGAGLANFYTGGKVITDKKYVTTLEPNVLNDDVRLQVTAGEHTLAGYHNLTVELKEDEALHGSVELSVKVNQFYQVKCQTEGDIDDQQTNFTIDPNNYTDEEEDFIKKSFIIKVQNHGNGGDEIALTYDDELDESDDIIDWRFAIISQDTEVGIQSVNVSNYDVTNVPKYGEEEVQFDVYIPIDIEVGSYIVDFIIESSGDEILNPLEDESDNNIVTFKFDIRKPNLRFKDIQQDSGADNFEFYDYYNAFPIQRDYEHDNLFYISVKDDNFDQLAIEFKVSIDNIGDSVVDLEPSNIWLNFTHEDEFGVIVHDDNLTANYPTSAKLIPPTDGENNETFSFLWEYLEQEHNSEVEYTFTITVDPLNKIYEEHEDDNIDEVKITIHHLKKKGDKSGGGSPGFEAMIMLAAIAIVLVALFDHRRKRQ